MKKTLIIILLFLSSNSYPSVSVFKNEFSTQIDLTNEVISTSSYFKYSIQNDKGYSYIDFKDSNVTTASINFLRFNGTSVSSNTLTSHKPIAINGYQNISFKIFNYSTSATVTLNGIINIWK